MKEKIKKIITDCAIPAVGFCAFSDIESRLLDCRAKQRLPENAKTVIVCLFPYRVREEKPENISRYAAVPDYHDVCGLYLSRATEKLKAEFTENKFEFFIDNSPIPEVYCASCGGLGVIGENGLLITQRWGSFVFIGEIVTDIEIESKNFALGCSGCGKCKAVCPVGLNKGECLSKISQKKGELTEDEAKKLKKNNIVWGCDICAEVCPMNKDAEKTEIPEFLKGYRHKFEAGEEIEGRAYAWRGEKPVNRNFENLK